MVNQSLDNIGIENGRLQRPRDFHSHRSLNNSNTRFGKRFKDDGKAMMISN